MDENSLRYYDHENGGYGNHAPSTMSENSTSANYRSRADSTVRFADMEEANGRGKIHHYPTLTPLSDSSSFQSNELPSDLGINGPITMVGQSSLRRSSYGGGPRTLRGQQQQQQEPLPPLPPPGVYSKEISSSSSSIDQWLQNSEVLSSTSTPPPKLVRDDSGKDMDSLSSYPAGDFRSQELQANSSSSFVANTTPGSRTATGPTINLSSPAKSSANRNQTTPSHSDISFDNRHMSEDERFALDYGDVRPTATLEAISSPLRQFVYLADRYADNHQAEHNGNETQRLIRATTPTNQYYSGRNSN